MRELSLAVILAAGQGRRIQGYIERIPKGFIEIGDGPLIHASLQTLLEFGVERVIIVTGYLPHFYDALRTRYPQVETVPNMKYADSGSMYSLHQAADLIDGDFLLLESDLIYEKRAVEALLNCGKDNAVLVSGPTCSGDEVYVGSAGDRIVNITKQRSEVTELAGELVGISKISRELFEVMDRRATEGFRETLHIEYESGALAQVARTYPVYYHLVEDLAWGEIDNEEHYLRARDHVHPKIVENNRRFLGGDPLETAC